MAAYSTELALVGAFWNLAAADHPDATRVAANLPDEVLEDPNLSAALRLLADRFAAGEPLDLSGVEVTGALISVAGPTAANQVWDAASISGGVAIGRLCRIVLESWRARRQAWLLEDLVPEAKRIAREDPAKGKAFAEEWSARILEIHDRTGTHDAPQTRGEITDAELASLEVGGVRGASWPYPKLQRELGPLLPGRVAGITSLPGGGKSTLLANLCGAWVRREIACIIAPTEMRRDWLRRMWAADAGVPQEVAENQLWNVNDPEIRRHLAAVWNVGDDEVRRRLEEYRHRYTETVERYRNLPWEVINRSDLSPDEIIGRARVLRRRFPGQMVVLAIDHMHNLSYPNSETDKHVGAATRKVREFCQDDTDGMAAVLLFQPRKPQSTDVDRLRPIPSSEIRGQVAQVLDTHISLFRRWVQTHPHFKTEWGTATCQYDDRGVPEFAKPEDPGAKLDDEHVYIKCDKRRIGGEGQRLLLNIDQPSGRIYELEQRRMLRAL